MVHNLCSRFTEIARLAAWKFYALQVPYPPHNVQSSLFTLIISAHLSFSSDFTGLKESMHASKQNEDWSLDILQIGLKIEKCSASDQNPLIWKSIARYNCPYLFDFLSWLPKCWKTDRRIMTSKIFQWKCQHEIGFYNIQSTAFSRPIWMLISLILEH